MARTGSGRSDGMSGLLKGLILLVLFAGMVIVVAVGMAQGASLWPWWLGDRADYWILVLGGLAWTVYGGARWLYVYRIAPGGIIWFRQTTYAFRMTRPDPRDREQIVWADIPFDPETQIAKLAGTSDQYFLGMIDPRMEAIKRTLPKPLVVSQTELRLHTVVIGSTGSGKSQLALRVLLHQHIAKGRGCMLITFKPDPVLLAGIVEACRHAHRLADLRYFSLDPSEEAWACSYNPLRDGSPVSRAERITQAMGMKATGPERFWVELTRQVLVLALEAADARGEVMTFDRLQKLLAGTYLSTERGEKPKLQGQFAAYLLSVQPKALAIDLYKRAVGIDWRNAADIRQIVDKWAALPTLNTWYPTLDMADVFRHNRIVIATLSTALGHDLASQVAIAMTEHATFMYQSRDLGRTEDSQLFIMAIDEFGSVGRLDFIAQLQQARSFSVAYALAFQVFADLEPVGRSFARQVLGNCSTHIVFKLRDGRDARMLAENSGSVLRPSPYSGVSEQKLLPGRPGDVSARDTEGPLIQPNQALDLPSMLSTRNRYAKTIVFPADGPAVIVTMRPLPRITEDIIPVLREVKHHLDEEARRVRPTGPTHAPVEDDRPAEQRPVTVHPNQNEHPETPHKRRRRGHRGGRRGHPLDDTDTRTDTLEELFGNAPASPETGPEEPSDRSNDDDNVPPDILPEHGPHV